MLTSLVRTLVFMFFTISIVFAAPPKEKIKIPNKIDGATTVNAEELIDVYQNSPELVVIDSRVTEDRAMGYIEESISLEDIDTNCFSLGRLIKNKMSSVAFYCNGPKCGRSVNATEIAVKCGYKKLYWFKGGFEEWQVKDYPYILK